MTTVTGAVAITYFNNSGRCFVQRPVPSPLGGLAVIGLGDMDEDGCIDAVQLSGYGLVTIAKGTCDGNFTEGTAIAELGDLLSFA